MNTKETIEAILAAGRAGDVWIFLISMVTLLCMVIWYDVKKDKRRVR